MSLRGQIIIWNLSLAVNKYHAKHAYADGPTKSRLAAVGR